MVNSTSMLPQVCPFSREEILRNRKITQPYFPPRVFQVSEPAKNVSKIGTSHTVTNITCRIRVQCDTVPILWQFANTDQQRCLPYTTLELIFP